MTEFRPGQYVVASISMSNLLGPSNFSIDGFIESVDSENKILHLTNGAIVYFGIAPVKVTVADNVVPFRKKKSV